MDALMWNRGPIGGPFELIDQDGRQRSDAQLRGKLLLIYFGYTSCPDVCPADLMAISSAVRLLGGAGDDVQPIFITVDPERDTTERLRAYVSAFHPRLIGLTDRKSTRQNSSHP
jgi:protein SCO1/2